MTPRQLFFQLPTSHRSEETLSLLSTDAQIYVGCEKCGWEDRANPMYLRSAQSLLDSPCGRCGSKERALVRHLEHVAGSCLDCGRDLAETVTATWLDLRCAACGSRRLDVQAMLVQPPFPPQFGDLCGAMISSTDPRIGLGKAEPWGIDPLADGAQINREVQWAVQMFPDSQLHVLCASLFCRRLRTSGAYAESDQFCWIVSLEGSLLRDYFRTTGEIAAALEGLELEEAAATVAPNEAARAAIDHNCAIDINGMLTRYPVDLIARASGRPNIRDEGLAAARRALAVYEQELASERPPEPGEEPAAGFYGARQQVMRTHHLIGDLFANGGGGQADLRAALQEFELALAFNVGGKLVTGVLQSRAEAIARLDDPTREQLLQAERDLITGISADANRVARSFQWMRFLQLARLARKLGEPGRELMALEEGASLALQQIRQNPEEMILQQRSERMTTLFDTLARAYADTDRPLEALSAAETLRAAAVRLHTMDDADRESADKQRRSIVARDLMPESVRHLFAPAEPERLTPEPLGAVLLGLLERLRDVPTVCVSYFFDAEGAANKIFACVCGPSDSPEPEIVCLSWPIPDDPIRWSEDLVSPGPFRERNLKRMHTAAHAAFLAPIQERLRQMKARRVVFVLPGLLTRLAFEALIEGPSPARYLLDDAEVAYLPSVALGFDLARAFTPKTNGRLLVVGYQGDDLTHAADEVNALQGLFGDRMKLLSGADCHKLAVLEELHQDYDYVHFVCHGTYESGAPLSAALHLTRNVEDDSQRLTAGDIFAHVRFRNQPIITLSACSTALMSSSPTNNCHGLTGSFLRAGARCVVGSRWPVYDDTAAAFMTRFYQKMTAGDPARGPLACLAAVQRELRADNRIENFAAFSYMGLP